MPSINLRQAQRPPSARCLSNAHGTAPGLTATLRRCRIWCLPGPPSEMQPMFERFVAPALFEGRDRPRLLVESIPVFGLGESAVAERLGELMHRERNPLVGTTASGSIVTVRLRAHGPVAEDRPAFDRLIAEVHRRVAPYALGTGPVTLGAALAAECAATGTALAFAESCTGGLAASMLCEVPGVSAWFRGGVVCYSNESKSSLLGVPPETISRHGAVSAETAAAMAAGAMERLGAGGALAITGIAGPDGGSESKPVGTVFIATVVGRGAACVRRFQFPGDRSAVRERAARAALGALRLHLRGEPATALLWQRGTDRGS